MTKLIRPDLERIPEELKDYSQWLVWRAEVRQTKAGKKLTKIPYTPSTNKKASTKNSSQWGTFDEAVEAYLMEGYDGIGFVFTENDPFVGIDLDNCFTPERKLNDDAKRTINTLRSYTEVSPSGKGIHIIAKGELPGSGHCDHATGHEMYQEGRFFTITAKIAKIAKYEKVVPSQEGISTLYDEWFGSSAHDVFDASELVWDDEAEITPLSNLNISDRLRDLIHKGKGIDLYDDDRSVALFSACQEMVALGINKESILTCLTDEDNYLAEPALERRRNNVKSAMAWVWEYTLGKVVAKQEFEREILGEGLDEDDDLGDDNLDDDDELCSIPYNDPEENRERSVNTDKVKNEEPLPFVPKDYEFNARLFLKEFPMISYNTFLYIFNGRFYEQVSKEQLESKVHKAMLGRKFPISLVDNTIKTVRRLANGRRFKRQPNFIAMKNGVLEITGWDKGNRDFKLHPHDKKFHVLSMMNFDYQPDVDAPVFNDFLSQVYQRDEGSIRLLKEYYGYCLPDDNRFQKILLMWGKSRSGKGTLLNLMEDLVGRHQSCAVNLRDIANSHGLSQLVNKKVSIIGEAKHTNKSTINRSHEVLLGISGGDTQSVNPKNKDEFSVKIRSKIIMACNDLPVFADSHNALANRYLILPHKVSFQGQEDPMLLTKLRKELPGIFNEILSALCDLGDRGRFIEPDSTQDKRKEMKLLQNPVGYFIDEFLTRTDSESDRVPKSEMFEAYLNMAHVLGGHKKTDRMFGKELRDNAPWIQIGKEKEVEKGQVRRNCYIGAKLDNEKIQELLADSLE